MFQIIRHRRIYMLKSKNVFPFFSYLILFKNTTIDFQPGDSFGIICPNPAGEVTELLTKLGLSDKKDCPVCLTVKSETKKKGIAVNYFYILVYNRRLAIFVFWFHWNICLIYIWNCVIKQELTKAKEMLNIEINVAHRVCQFAVFYACSLTTLTGNLGL